MKEVVDFENGGAVIRTDIVLVRFQVAKLFGRLLHFLLNANKSATVG